MLNEQRLRMIKFYSKRLVSKEVFKVLNPVSVARTLKTIFANKNMRSVPHDELWRDAEASVHGLARLTPNVEQPPLEQWLPIELDVNVVELGEMLKAAGSDKSTAHDYFEVYGSILSAKRDKAISILEIGLGTNNLAFQSNMGLWGCPGASLRAFRDWAPKAYVVGADIDRNVLFSEERIKTYFVDQTSVGALNALADQEPGPYDLIIDDGLHLPHANFNTIEALLPLLKPDGTMVIEDIDAIHLHYWHAVAPVLSNYETYLQERLGGYIFIIRNRRQPESLSNLTEQNLIDKS